MRYLFIALLFLTGCNIKSYEERQRDQINEDKTRLIDQIIAADKHKNTYEILVIYKYRYALADVIDKVALRDGWNLVGGMVVESNAHDPINSTYMQTIRKVDKTLYVYRLADGTLALGNTIKDEQK